MRSHDSCGFINSYRCNYGRGSGIRRKLPAAQTSKSGSGQVRETIVVSRAGCPDCRKLSAAIQCGCDDVKPGNERFPEFNHTGETVFPWGP